MGKKIGNFVVQHIFAALWYALFSVAQSLMLVMALFYLVLDDTEWGKTFIQGLSNDSIDFPMNAVYFASFACGIIMAIIYYFKENKPTLPGFKKQATYFPGEFEYKTGVVIEKTSQALFMIMSCLVFINLVGILLPENLIESYNQSIQWTNEGSILFELLSIGILGPISEEILFRGLMFACLEKAAGRKYAIVVSSLIFALSHGHLVQMSYAFVLGILFALLDYDYKSTGKGYIFPSIVAHITVNSSSVIFERFGASAIIQYISLIAIGIISFILYRYERTAVKDNYAYYCDSITKNIESLKRTMQSVADKGKKYKSENGMSYSLEMSDDIQEAVHGIPYVYNTNYGVGCGRLIFYNMHGVYLVQRVKDKLLWNDSNLNSFSEISQYDAAFNTLVTKNIDEAVGYFIVWAEKESLKDKRKAMKNNRIIGIERR